MRACALISPPCPVGEGAALSRPPSAWKADRQQCRCEPVRRDSQPSFGSFIFFEDLDLIFSCPYTVLVIYYTREPEPMILVDLNSADDRPIYGQIADRVKFAVAGGVLRPGDLVPSVRELSKQLVVNPNTVARAYRDLQTEGLLESVRGMGLQVAEGAVDRCRAARREMVRQRLRQAIEDARQSKMDPAEIEVILREEWARGKGPGNGDVR